MQKNIYQEALTFHEILSIAGKIFKENLKDILLITAIIYIPVSLALYFLWQNLNSPDVSFRDYTNYMKIAGWLENIFWVIASLFVIFLTKAKLDGQITNFQELIKKALSFWGKWVYGNIIYGLFVWLLLILLIIPWIIFAIFWFFYLQIIAFEKSPSVSKSLEYSKKLVKGRWWEIFWYGCMYIVWIVLLSFALGLVSGVIPYGEGIIIDTITSLMIDIYCLFFLIIVTLKFINLDSLVNGTISEKPSDIPLVSPTTPEQIY